MTTIFRPNTKEMLQNAIKLYMENNTSAIQQYGNINTWDVSAITDMTKLFNGLKRFNYDISNWNVSNVTNMKEMFKGCATFNQPLNSWNVSNVTIMTEMFSNCKSFNQPLDKWTVSKVVNMHGMFANCVAFNQPLNDWILCDELNDISGIFYRCANFNQPLNKWNVSNVSFFNQTFYRCINFNQSINEWNTKSAINMSEMFLNCKKFNQPLNDWNVSSVLRMTKMFSNCEQFNQPLNNWDVSSVYDMDEMFFHCYKFNQPLNNWNMSNVSTMMLMFAGCSSLNQSFSNWMLNPSVTEPNENLFMNTQVTEFPRRQEYEDEYEEQDEDEDEEQDEDENEERQPNYVVDPINRNQTFQFDKNKTGMDIISGEEVTAENYLKEGPENIIFVLNDKYYYTNLSQMNNLRQDPSVVKYPCHQVEQSIVPRLENVDLNLPLFPLKSIGMYNGYILLTSVITMLSHPNIKVYILEEKERIPTVTSHQMLTSHANAVSATHCQEGHSDIIYSITWADINVSRGGKCIKHIKRKTNKKKKIIKRKTRHRKI